MSFWVIRSTGISGLRNGWRDLRREAALRDLWQRSRDNHFTRDMVNLRRASRSFLDYASGGLGAVTNAHDGLPAYRQHGVLGERLAESTQSTNERSNGRLIPAARC